MFSTICVLNACTPIAFPLFCLLVNSETSRDEVLQLSARAPLCDSCFGR